MKKILYILVIFIVLPVSGQINLGNKGGSFLSKNGVFLSYTIPSEPEEPAPYSQIIADHSVVALYDDIPQQWIDSVKKMFVTVAGQSHAEGYFTGVQMLEELDPTYAVSVVSSGTPESYTTSNLRMSGAMWGNLENATGWIYGYDTWDWAGGTPYAYTYSPTQAERIMAGISYAHNNGLTKAAMAYGYCYNEGYWESYITATQALVDYCEAEGLPTKVFFTTGPADGHLAAATEEAYTESLRWTAIRNHVLADSTLILFDYNDILSYNDAGQQQTNTWNGHTFPVIHTENTTGDITCYPCASGHIGGNGCLKLGKAMWWMLARIAGWDGIIE